MVETFASKLEFAACIYLHPVLDKHKFWAISFAQKYSTDGMHTVRSSDESKNESQYYLC